MSSAGCKMYIEESQQRGRLDSSNKSQELTTASASQVCLRLQRWMKKERDDAHRHIDRGHTPIKQSTVLNLNALRSCWEQLTRSFLIWEILRASRMREQGRQASSFTESCVC